MEPPEDTDESAEFEEVDEPFVFVIETLSIGKGVPEGAREALEQCREILGESEQGGSALTLSESYIGLEGEQRLIIEFADPKLGRAAYERIAEIVAGVELISVEEAEVEHGPED